MARHTQVPIKKVGNQDWGDLSALGLAHEVIGETVKCRDQQLSFAGGHRVRLYYFKKNVHWRIAGQEFDISDVQPPQAARKRQRGHP